MAERHRRTLELDGDWERRDFIDEAWRWSDALRPANDRAGDDTAADAGPPVQAGVSAGWRAARVPGSALDDAWRSGEIPNPYVDRNSLAAEWIPERTWLYRRRFRVPDDTPPRAVLRFDGIDPGGIVLLDGEEIGRHAGMFVPWEVGLERRLVPGTEHTLVVALHPAPEMPSQVARTEDARLHRSRMGYGWDFCPRMIHTGIWRSVSLELFEARIVAPQVSVELAPDAGAARVTASCRIEGGDADARLSAAILDASGAAVAEGRAAADGGEVRIGLEVADPHLWWPNGVGPQPLYRLQLRLENEEVLDERSLRFGVRSIVASPVAGADPNALPYTLVVNGRPTWIRGWNWTPMDAAFGVPRPERLRHLIELARRANVNLLRVWGGGLIESDEFYDACDAAGIMVWQEFGQSSSGVSNTPTEDPAFLDLMRREAEAIVPLCTHHPSLVIWCGGNELAWPDGRPLDDRHPVLAALRKVVGRLDPTRIWLPTSPTGPRFDNSLAAIAEEPAGLHDVHGPWEHQGLAEEHALANATTSLLHSEFGVEGMTNLATLREVISDGRHWAADRRDPVIAHHGAWWNNEPFVQRLFGGNLTLEELERASQHLQADGLRTLIEGDRRRWPRNAGSLPWAFNEPFPNAWSNAAVDYFGVPKAAYHAVAEAYAPVLPGASIGSEALDAAAELTLTPWIVNDTDAPLSGPMEVTLHDAFGLRLDGSSIPMEVAPNAVGVAEPISLDVPPTAAEIVVLDISLGEHRSRRLLSRTADLGPMRRLPPATVDATMRREGDRWSIELSCAGPAAALELRLADDRPVGWPERSGAAYVTRNLVTLLPGERMVVDVDWVGVRRKQRVLHLSGWNVADQVLIDA